MSIKRTFNGATILHPGAYTAVKVQDLTGFPLQATGIVGIIGEADGGEPGVLDIITGSQFNSAKDRYRSGPIADAIHPLAQPSVDPRVPAGASTIIIYKVNKSTQAELTLKNSAVEDFMKLVSGNWGSKENNLSCTASWGDVPPESARIEGGESGDFTFSGGETMALTVNDSDYTFTAVAGTYDPATMVGELTNVARWSPSLPIGAEVYATDKLAITPALSFPEYDYTYMSVSGAGAAILGLSGLSRGIKGNRVFVLNDGVSTETSESLGGDTVMTVSLTGDACNLSIKEQSGQLKLTTECPNPTNNLDIVLAEYVDGVWKSKTTIGALADKINAHTAYSAEASSGYESQNALLLDYYENLAIGKDGTGSLTADLYRFENWFNISSQLANAEKVVNAVGNLLPLPVPNYFTGGTDGVPTNTDWADGFEALKAARVNSVVPLISADKGSVSIDSVNAFCSSHVTYMSATKQKSERQAFVSKLGTKAEFKAAAKALNNGLVSIYSQDPRITSQTHGGELTYLDPWALCCIAAGVRSGTAVGEPLTYKTIDINALRVRDNSWSPKIDYDEIIDAGCSLVEPLDSAGFRFVVDNTTYGVDPNFVWNRGSVIEASYFVAYDLRFNLELVFTGTKAKTGSAANISSFIKSRMDIYLDADITVGDDENGGKGWKDLSVVIEGSAAIINMTATPVQGIDFILPTIYLADIRQSAA